MALPLLGMHGRSLDPSTWIPAHSVFLTDEFLRARVSIESDKVNTKNRIIEMGTFTQ